MKMKVTLANTSLQCKVDGKRSHKEYQQDLQWLGDVKEWTRLSSNAMWKEPEDRVAWKKYVSCVASII